MEFISITLEITLKNIYFTCITIDIICFSTNFIKSNT